MFCLYFRFLINFLNVTYVNNNKFSFFNFNDSPLLNVNNFSLSFSLSSFSGLLLLLNHFNMTPRQTKKTLESVVACYILSFSFFSLCVCVLP